MIKPFKKILLGNCCNFYLPKFFFVCIILLSKWIVLELSDASFIENDNFTNNMDLNIEPNTSSKSSVFSSEHIPDDYEKKWNDLDDNNPESIDYFNYSFPFNNKENTEIWFNSNSTNSVDNEEDMDSFTDILLDDSSLKELFKEIESGGEDLVNIPSPSCDFIKELYMDTFNDLNLSKHLEGIHFPSPFHNAPTTNLSSNDMDTSFLLSKQKSPFIISNEFDEHSIQAIKNKMLEVDYEDDDMYRDHDKIDFTMSDASDYTLEPIHNDLEKESSSSNSTNEGSVDTKKKNPEVLYNEYMNDLMEILNKDIKKEGVNKKEHAVTSSNKENQSLHAMHVEDIQGKGEEKGEKKKTEEEKKKTEEEKNETKEIGIHNKEEDSEEDFDAQTKKSYNVKDNEETDSVTDSATESESESEIETDDDGEVKEEYEGVDTTNDYELNSESTVTCCSDDISENDMYYSDNEDHCYHKNKYILMEIMLVISKINGFKKKETKEMLQNYNKLVKMATSYSIALMKQPYAYKIHCMIKKLCHYFDECNFKQFSIKQCKRVEEILESHEFLKVYLSIASTLNNRTFYYDKKCLNRKIIVKKRHILDHQKKQQNFKDQAKRRKITFHDFIFTDASYNLKKRMSFLKYLLFINEKPHDLNCTQILKEMSIIIGLSQSLFLKFQHMKLKILNDNPNRRLTILRALLHDNKNGFLKCLYKLLSSIKIMKKNVVHCIKAKCPNDHELCLYFYFGLGGILMKRMLINPGNSAEAHFILDVFVKFLNPLEKILTPLDLLNLRAQDKRNIKQIIKQKEELLYLMMFFGELEITYMNLLWICKHTSLLISIVKTSLVVNSKVVERKRTSCIRKIFKVIQNNIGVIVTLFSLLKSNRKDMLFLHNVYDRGNQINKNVKIILTLAKKFRKDLLKKQEDPTNQEYVKLGEFLLQKVYGMYNDLFEMKA